MTTGTIYSNHNNTVTLTLTDGGVDEDLSAATKVEVVIGDTAINSVDAPTAFDLTGLATGVIVLDFGGQSIAVGVYQPRVVIYDATNTDGIVWQHEDDEDGIIITVVTD